MRMAKEDGGQCRTRTCDLLLVSRNRATSSDCCQIASGGYESVFYRLLVRIGFTTRGGQLLHVVPGILTGMRIRSPQLGATFWFPHVCGGLRDRRFLYQVE